MDIINCYKKFITIAFIISVLLTFIFGLIEHQNTDILNRFATSIMQSVMITIVAFAIKAFNDLKRMEDKNAADSK